MNTTLGKILLFVGLILTIGMLGFVIYNQHELSKQQTAIQTEQVAQRALLDGVVRSQTSWATQQDVANLLAANGVTNDALKSIQADMSTLKATMTTANVVTVNSTAQNTTGQASTGTGPANPTPPVPVANGCPDPDPFGFQKAQQNYVLNEEFGTLKVPFGTVGFSAWQQNPWSADVPARTYTVDNIIGTDENQRNYVYNQVNIQTAGKTYQVPITTSTTKQVYPSAKFSFWNPRLLLGADGGVNLNHVKGEFTPSVNLGIMSYGQYKTNPDFSILEVGAGWSTVNQRPSLVITPVQYNLGRNVFSPLMNNLYVGPSVTVGTDGSWTLQGGVRVGL
jgi:hypothetical protein